METPPDVKRHAHIITTPGKFELSPKPGRLNSLLVAKGDLVVRIVHMYAGQKLPLHAHSKRIDKFLLSGKISYDGDQEFTIGSHAKLEANLQYDVEALEASNLLLIERAKSATIDASRKTSEFVHSFDKFVIWISAIFHRVNLLWKRSWLPTVVILMLVVPSSLLLRWYWPTSAEELKSFYRDIAVSLMSALVFLLITGLAQWLYVRRVPKMYEAFDLDVFCQQISQAKRVIRIYSTYSNLFLNGPLFHTFEMNAFSHLDPDHRRSIEILLLDPTSDAAEQRRSERKDVNVKEKIIENLKTLQTVINSSVMKEYIKVRIANSLPKHQHHQIDNDIYFSFYPRSFAASEARYIHCTEDSTLGQFAIGAFQDVWTDSQFTLPLDIYLKRHPFADLDKMIPAEGAI